MWIRAEYPYGRGCPGSGHTTLVFDHDAPYHWRGEGFHEREIARRSERFGRIVHVWTTYESLHSLSDAQPFARGINSIQLFHDGTRWWILSVYWQGEPPEAPIPTEYLPPAR